MNENVDLRKIVLEPGRCDAAICPGTPVPGMETGFPIFSVKKQGKTSGKDVEILCYAETTDTIPGSFDDAQRCNNP